MSAPSEIGRDGGTRGNGNSLEGAFNSTGHIHLTSDIIANLTVIVLSKSNHIHMDWAPCSFSVNSL